MSPGMSLGIIHLYDSVQWLITKHNGMLIEQNSLKQEGYEHSIIA